MKHTKKALAALLLSLVLVLGLLPGMSLTARADEMKIGEATYTITDGVLTVGSGSFTKEQWRAIFLTTNSKGTPTGPKDIAKTITKVVFEDGATATSNATAGMFYGWTVLQEADLSKLNTSGVTDMWSMFKGCTKLESVDLKGLNTASVTYMDNMFSGCSTLKSLDVSKFDTSKVTTMESMFTGCSGVTKLDLSSFDTKKCTNFKYMFNGCGQLTTITVGENWTAEGQKSWSQMFENCTNLVGGNGTTYVSGKGKEYAIIDGTDGKPGFLTGSAQKHAHSFAYTVEGAVITATCTATTGVCGLTEKITLTLKAPEINTYGMGQNEKATLEGTAVFNEATGKAISEENIEYYKGDTKLNVAPKDAGSYIAKITVESQTATVSYTIQKGNNINGVGKPQVDSKTENSITLKSTEGYEYKCGEGDWQASNVFTGLTANTSYIFYQRIAETDNLKPSAASEGAEISTNPHIHVHDLEYSLSQDGKTITATCKKTDPGHTGADSAALTISTPKQLVVPETRDVGSTVLSIISPDYAPGLTWREFNEFTGLDIQPNQIKYFTLDGETETAIDSYPYEAGLYRAKITAGDKTASVDYTISKIDLTADKFTYTAPENLVYNGEAKTATVTSKKEGVGEVTVEYWNADDQKLDGAPVNAGTYTVKICVSESKRYNSAEHLTAGEWTFAITTGNAAVKTAPTAKTLTYNGSAQELVTAGEASGGEIQYALGTDATTAPADNLYTTSIPTATNVGTYYVWYKVVGNANHNDTAAARIDVTIRSADTTPTNPSADTLTYTGEAQALVTGGAVAGGELQYALGSDADAAPALERFTATVPTGTDAGTYYVWYRIKGDANHNDVAPVCIEVSIAKAAIAPTVSITGWTYGETANAPSVTGNTGNGEVSYTYSDAADGTFTATVPSNAGTYYVKATVAESDNYLGATTQSLSFAIAKANVNVSAEAKSKTYGDADPELTYTVTGLVGSDKLTGALTRANGENVGTYAIQQGTLAAGDNYMLTFSGANLTIGKKAIAVTADAKSKVEGESDPELTYTVTGLVGSDKLIGALARDTGDAPGDYAITQGTLTASDNYTLTFKGAKLTITAKPIAPTDTPTQRPVVPDYTLLATMKASGKTAMKLSWTKVAVADGYDVFFKKCDGKSDYPLVASVKGRDTLSYKITGLKKSTSYKAYVKAWKMVNGAKTYIGKASPTLHAITGNYTRSKTNAKKVTVKASKVTLAIGKTSTIKASVKGVKSGRGVLVHAKKLRYYSSDRNVATVTSAGKIKATGTGSCTIYVIANNGVRASVKVTVVDGLTKIAFKKSSYSVKKGKTLKLASKITLTPSGVTTAYTWTSSNPSIATVSAKGVVKGIKKGTVTITVTSANGKTATTKVKVN